VRPALKVHEVLQEQQELPGQQGSLFPDLKGLKVQEVQQVLPALKVNKVRQALKVQ
jgi:hypothetical protein